MVAGTTGASAQAPPQPGCTSTLPPGTDFGQSQIVGGAVGAANAINTVIGTINTSFLAQGNAFVAGLPNPAPDQTSGGIWGRVIGGRVDEKATGTFTGGTAFLGFPLGSGTVSCNSDVRMNYGGFQMGQDIARLNIGGNGGTIHVGVTGGYAEANAQDRGGSNFTGNFQIPFVGAYAAYTRGKFFADVLVRGDFYQMNLFSPDAALSNQRLNAAGGTVSGSLGYRFDLGHDWFFEPSASGIYSRVRIDTLNAPEGFGNSGNRLALSPATIAFSDYVSTLGRLGARVGTTWNGGSVIWQPFATASVWHEFEGASTAAFSIPDTISFVSVNGTLSNTRVGTYGQYSIGTAAQVVGSPVLAYVRVDYKNGSNIEGLGFNAGLRYNFDPSVKGVAVPGIFKAQPRLAAVAYDWTGFYVGGFTGATVGDSKWFFPDIASGVNTRTAGLLAGVDAGYRKQFGSWVVGVEGDLAATNAKGGTSCFSNINNVAFGGAMETNCNNDIRWMATATGKLGYAWNRVMLYGKAGGAWTDNTLDVSCNADPIVAFNCTPANSFVNIAHASATVHQFGWTAGIGFELALNRNWSAKAEYDYLNFGTQNVVLTDTTRVSLRQDFNQVKIGLNYRFGPSDDEVVANPGIPLKAKAAPVVAFNWTGGYIGAAAADRWSDASWNTTAIGFVPGLLVAPDPTTTPVSFFSSAAQGRLFGGYNWQFSRKWVAGVEGDVGFGDSRMTRGGIPGTFGNGFNAFSFAPGTEGEQHDSSSVKLGWDASIRGRFGMLIAPSVLFYGTGGVAFQQVSTSAACDGLVDPFGGISWCAFGAKSQTFSTTRTGWTVGGGVEAVITGNWLARGEVRYADYGNFKQTFFAGTGDDVVTNFHLSTYTALAGVSYKFGPNAVVARY
jgi:opacity protein-like surface antigen